MGNEAPRMRVARSEWGPAMTPEPDMVVDALRPPRRVAAARGREEVQ